MLFSIAAPLIQKARGRESNFSLNQEAEVLGRIGQD